MAVHEIIKEHNGNGIYFINKNNTTTKHTYKNIRKSHKHDHKNPHEHAHKNTI